MDLRHVTIISIGRPNTKQPTSTPAHTKAKPMLTSVSLEIDASSFRLRQRVGLLEVDARYYCFAAQLGIS